MKDLEKQIEEASIKYIKTRYKRDDIDRDAKFGFINGAKSEAAKAFHQQGMYSEEEVKQLCSNAQLKYAFATISDQPYSVDEFDKSFDYWFNQNKKK